MLEYFLGLLPVLIVGDRRLDRLGRFCRFCRGVELGESCTRGEAIPDWIGGSPGENSRFGLGYFMRGFNGCEVFGDWSTTIDKGREIPNTGGGDRRKYFEWTSRLGVVSRGGDAAVEKRLLDPWGTLKFGTAGGELGAACCSLP